MRSDRHLRIILQKMIRQEFAAWLSLVPRQSSTGGRVRLLGISKRGSSYLRVLLIHCGRAVVGRQKTRSEWLEQLLARRPWNVAVVAQANKIARTIWAILAHGRAYDENFSRAQPA